MKGAAPGWLCGDVARPRRCDRGLSISAAAFGQEAPAAPSAIAEDLRAVDARLGSVETGLRDEIRSLETGLRQAIDAAQVQTRVLFEHDVGRLAVIDEGKNVTPRKRKPKKR